MRRLCAVVLWLLPLAGHAQPVVADIEGRIEIIGGNYVPPGTLARAVLTIRNNGPDIGLSPGVGTFYLATVGFRTLDVFAIPETLPCSVNYTDFVPPPPEPATLGVSIRWLQPLAAGQTATCTVGIVTYPEAPTFIHQWFRFGAFASDPIPANNNVTVIIQTRPAMSIPSTSTAGLAVLGLLLMVVAIARLRAQRRVSL